MTNSDRRGNLYAQQNTFSCLPYNVFYVFLFGNIPASVFRTDTNSLNCTYTYILYLYVLVLTTSVEKFEYLEGSVTQVNGGIVENCL